MNLKKFLFSLIFLIIAMFAHAIEFKVVLHTSNGEVDAALTNLQNITIDGDNMVINLKNGEKITTPVASISKISLEDANRNALSLNIEEKVVLATDGAQLIVNGFDGTQNLVIANIFGQVVMNKSVTSGDHIALTDFSPGIYIASIGNTSIKFIRK